MTARIVPGSGAADAVGAVVVVDVLRAFTTAAYAFAAGARRIVLVREVSAALDYKAAHPGALAVGEDRGLRLPGFDFANSPAEVSTADLDGRVLVLRTTAGTRGVVEAARAERRWCAGLVVATATAAAVTASGLGEPTYVATGWRGDDLPGLDDVETARLVERLRRGEPPRADDAADAVRTSREARRTLALGAGNVDPRDVALACRVDAFDFAMEVRAAPDGLELVVVRP
ncbi:2-phosphosulfolactate phosphatase [Jatrophihabitans fulvus]